MSTMESAKSTLATVRVEFWVFENAGLGPVTLPVSAAISVSDLCKLVKTPAIRARFTEYWGWRDFSGVTWLKPDNCQLTPADWNAKLSSFVNPPTNTVTFTLKPPASAPIAAGAGMPGEGLQVMGGTTATDLALLAMMHGLEGRLDVLLDVVHKRSKQASVSFSNYGRDIRAQLNSRAVGYLKLAQAAHREDIFRVLSGKNPTWVPKWDSEAVLSEEEVENLKVRLGKIETFSEEFAAPTAEPSARPSFTSDETQQRIITKFMTPHLWQLLHPEVDAKDGPAKSPLSYGIMNCEEHCWLALTSDDNPCKPHLFDAPWYAVAEKNDSAVQLSDIPDKRFVYGRIRHPIFTAVGAVRMILEAKVNILSDQSLGALAYYCSLLPGAARAIGFDAERFILYESFRGIPNFAIEGKWSDRGSKDIIKAFYWDQACPLTKALPELLGYFELTLDEFLGAGASGIVFRTWDAENKAHALKVVPKFVTGTKEDWCYRLDSLLCEHTLMLKAASKGAPVAKMAPDSYLRGVDFCAVLLDTVGYAFEVTTRHDVMCAFAVLLSLHQKKLVHGDARVANLISTIPITTRVKGNCKSLPEDHNLLWIDMFNALPTDYTGDAHTLARSILGSGLFARHADMLPAYRPEQDAAYAFAEAVWKLYKAPRVDIDA